MSMPQSRGDENDKTREKTSERAVSRHDDERKEKTSTPPVTPATTKTTTPTSSSPGSGHLSLSTSGPHAVFSTLRATYPLKLLSPSPLPSQPPNLAIAYTLAYGGGLVAGDLISLQIDLEPKGGLVLLTQGSTKVFRNRPGIRPASRILRSGGKDGFGDVTTQRMHVTLSSGSFALVLPDSISPFGDSQYVQAQRFILPADESASVLILDWVNSGRGKMSAKPPAGAEGSTAGAEGDGEGVGEGEVWQMKSYTSTNEVWLADKRIMREKMILRDDTTGGGKTCKDGLNALARKLAPYHVYATLLIYGPHLSPLLDYLRKMVDQTTQYQIHRPPGLTWSFSDLCGAGGLGAVVRIGATSVEEARGWIRGLLSAGGIRELVGEGVWPRVI